MSRLLQVIGVVALLAWTGGGLVAWQLAGQQVHVTIAEGDDPDDARSIALARLDDRLGTLEGDLRALVAALGENLGSLDEGLRTAVHDESLHLDRKIAELSRNSAQHTADLPSKAEIRALTDAFARLELAVARQATAAPETDEIDDDEPVAVASSTGDESAVAPVTEPDPAPVADTRPIEAEPSTSDDAAVTSDAEAADQAEVEKPKRSSFLAFRLPSDDLKFDESRTWRVLPTLSRVGFDAKSTLHDFTGVTSDLSAELTANLAHPEEGATCRVVVSADALKTGLEDRDDAMYEHLDTEHHDQIVWEMTGFASDVIDAEKRAVTGTASGRFTIHGVTRDVTMPVTLRIDESRRLVVEGEMPLRLTDYEIPVPNQLGLVKMEDEVRVWISLRARPEPRKAD